MTPYGPARICKISAGQATEEILIALPLPIMCSWAALAQQAYRLNLTKVATSAVATLTGHFTVAQPPSETWEAHPMEVLHLNQHSAAAASPPLLRAFALVLYTHACRHLERAPVPFGDRCVAVRDHVARLVTVKQLLIGLQV